MPKIIQKYSIIKIECFLTYIIVYFIVINFYCAFYIGQNSVCECTCLVHYLYFIFNKKNEYEKVLVILYLCIIFLLILRKAICYKFYRNDKSYYFCMYIVL